MEAIHNHFGNYIEEIKVEAHYDELASEILEILRHIIYTNDRYDSTIKIDYCKSIDNDCIECQISCKDNSLKSYFSFVFNNYSSNIELHCFFKDNNTDALDYTATNWDDLKNYVNEYIECFYNGFIE